VKKCTKIQSWQNTGYNIKEWYNYSERDTKYKYAGFNNESS
jgi:hypothetical protein